MKDSEVEGTGMYSRGFTLALSIVAVAVGVVVLHLLYAYAGVAR